ncbi:hypothetical protein OC835_007245, partial [Tilletia horrida]
MRRGPGEGVAREPLIRRGQAPETQAQAKEHARRPKARGGGRDKQDTEQRETKQQERDQEQQRTKQDGEEGD